MHGGGYNWATPFLGEINTGTWPCKLWEYGSVKYDHAFPGPQAQDRLPWRGPTAAVNYRPVLSLERPPYNDTPPRAKYNFHGSEKKIGRGSLLMA
jgi:hypothetical protein